MLTPAYALTATERVLPSTTFNFSSAVLGPRITFTRSGNTATVTNADGSISLVNADTPRFPYLNGVCQGLLIEQASTNLLFNSAWAGAAAGTPGTIPTDWFAPFTPGGTLALSTDSLGGNILTITVSNNRHVYARGYPLSANTAHCFSLTVDSNPNNVQAVQFIGGQSFPAGTTSQYFINDVAVVSSAVPPSNSRVTFRVTVGATAGPSFAVRFGFGVSSNVTGAASMSKPQAEALSFSTSYIPTPVGATATRDPDIATMTGTNFSDWWTAGTGSVVARGRQIAAIGVCPWLQFDDATADNLIQLRGNATNPELYIKATTDQATIDAGTIAANTLSGFAAAWATDSCAAAFNGVTAGTDTSATIPTVTQARIGSDGTNYLNGTLQDIRYWPQRLTNAEVSAFSKL